MSITRNMYAPSLDMEALVQALIAWYSSQKLEVERLPSQSVMLQCREYQAWRKFVGMAMGLHVELNYSDPGLTVTISAGKWVDKAVVGGIAIAMASSGIGLPLAIPAAFGYWQQKKLPDRTFSFIEEVIASQQLPAQLDTTHNLPPRRPLSSSIPPRPPDENERNSLIGARNAPNVGDFRCPICGAPNPMNASSCQACRKPLVLDLEESAFKMKPASNRASSENASSTRTTRQANNPVLDSRSTSETTAAPKAVTCPRCGKQVTLGKRFCGNCGLQFNKDDTGGTNGATSTNVQASQAGGIQSTGKTAAGRTTLAGVILVIEDSAQRINLPTRPEVVIGRCDKARNYFPDLDLAPYRGEACGVSREHARLRIQNGGIVLEDLDSPNGTWLGNEQLLSGINRLLCNGDKLRFGKLAVTVLIP